MSQDLVRERAKRKSIWPINHTLWPGLRILVETPDGQRALGHMTRDGYTVTEHPGELTINFTITTKGIP